MKRSSESVSIDIPLIVLQLMKCIHHTVCRCACIVLVFFNMYVIPGRKLQVNCCIYKLCYFLIFQRKGHSLGLISVLILCRVLTAGWFQTWRLPAEALWVSVNKRTHELHGAFEPFKGIIFWSHSHLRTYRFSVHYISLGKLPSRLWKMVLLVVLKPERQHLTNEARSVEPQARFGIAYYHTTYYFCRTAHWNLFWKYHVK